MAEILSAHDAGLFYTPGDAQAFSQAIQRLATDAPLRQHMGRNALKVYQEVFDATHVSERYADLIEGLSPRCITDTQA